MCWTVKILATAHHPRGRHNLYLLRLFATQISQKTESRTKAKMGKNARNRGRIVSHHSQTTERERVLAPATALASSLGEAQDSAGERCFVKGKSLDLIWKHGRDNLTWQTGSFCGMPPPNSILKHGSARVQRSKEPYVSKQNSL